MHEPGEPREEPPGSSQLSLVSRGARTELERRFQLLAVLGRGAMGTVLRARDREAARDVALKLPLRGGDPRRLARFAREGEITASLAHPGIVAVHSAGVFEDQPWIAYELVQGARTLADLLPELPQRRRIELLRDAARALGHAHERGVVHRDVKPDNLLVDAEGRLKVADFGLAASEGQERLTQTGAVLGTPHYMAPEQLGGRTQAGPPADVWALGVILYQALTDRLPFAGESFLALAHAIAKAQPERPRRAASGVPAALESVCLRALARDPAARYPDAGELAADLDAWLGGAPISASAARAGGFRRPPSRTLLLGASALLALGLLVASQLPSAPRAAPSAPGAAAASSSSGAGSTRALAARERWAQLRGLPLAERVRGAGEWLDTWGDLPQAAEVRAEVAGRPRPRAGPQLRHAQGGWAHATWLSPGVLLTWGEGGSLAWWALPEGRLERRWRVGGEATSALVAAGGRFWLGDPQGRLRFAPDPRPEQAELALETPSEERAAILALAVSDAGALAAGGNGWAKLFQPKVTFSLDLIDPVRGMGFVREGQALRLVVASGDKLDFLAVAENIVRVYALEDGRVLHEDKLGFMPTALAAAPDGSRFAVGTSSGHVLLYSPAAQRLRALTGRDAGSLAQEGVIVSDMPLGCRGVVRGLAWTRDGRHVLALASTPWAATEPRRELRAWDADTGEETWCEEATGGRLPGSLALSPDGARLAIGTREGLVEVWEVE